MPLRNGVHCTVDSIALVIAWRKDVLACAIGLLDNFQFLVAHPLSIVDFCKISVVKLCFSWEVIHPKGTFPACKEVVFLKTLSIGAIGKGDIHHLGVFHGLLYSKRDGVVGIFGLHDSDGCGSVIIKHIVGKLGLVACHKVSSQVDLAIG